MALLNRKQIVKRTQGYKTEVVSVPEWGGDVIVRELTADETTKIGVAAMDAEGLDIGAPVVSLDQIAETMPKIVAWTVVDEDLNPLLTVEDVKAMTASNMEVINRLGTKALELSGLTEEMDEAEAEQDPNA